jgi:hypothetical protein
MIFDGENNSKSSTWIIALMMLLSLLPFSRSVSAMVDSRKPVNRETIAKQNLFTKKQTISLRQVLLFLTSREFLKNADRISLAYSVPQHTRGSQTALRIRNIRKLSLPEIHQGLQLHAPRSADLIYYLSNG